MSDTDMESVRSGGRDGVGLDWPSRSFLGRLAPSTRQALAGMGTRREYSHSGETLLSQGEHSDHVVLLWRACVKVTATTVNGWETLLGVRMSGDVVGELAALDGVARSASITTCGPAVIHTISRAEFEDFLRGDAAASVELTRMEAERLRWANRRRVDYAGCSVGIRLARVLVDLADAYGVKVGGGRIGFDMRLTQAELAHLVGAAEVTINKELAYLKRTGLIKANYAHPVILDFRRLKSLAGE